MSIILNGGVNGSGVTDALYAASKIATTLPFTIGLYFQTGNNSGSGANRLLCALAEATPATDGDNQLACRVTRATGPIMGFSTSIRATSENPSTYAASNEFYQSVTNVTVGTETVITVAAPVPVFPGQLLRLDGTWTGVSGLSSGRDYVVSAVNGNVITLAASSSGTFTGPAQVKPTAWDPNEWNLHVVTFKETADRRQAYGGPMTDLLNASTQGITAITTIFGNTNRFCLGGLYQNTSISAPFSGRMCHAALWDNKHVTRAEAIELLSVGPTAVSWGTPTAYWPLMGNLLDSIGSNHLTALGTPTFDADQPSIFDGPPPPSAWDLDDGERGVILNGSGFGSLQGRLVVTQSPSPGSQPETDQIIESWSDTQIVFTVGRGQVPAATDVNLLVLSAENNTVLETIVVNIAARTLPVRPASNILSDSALAAGS